MPSEYGACSSTPAWITYTGSVPLHATHCRADKCLPLLYACLRRCKVETLCQKADKDTYFGEAAKKLAAEYPKHSLFLLKRILGTRFDHDDVQVCFMQWNKDLKSH